MDNFVEMWKRLDEKYGDEGKVVDINLADVKNFEQIKNNENKRLIQFIDVLEKAKLPNRQHQLIIYSRKVHSEIKNGFIQVTATVKYH